MKITIVIDNEADGALKKEWGFAALIESNERILFDTGASKEVLAYNAEKLGIKPQAIDKLVISHDHWDHTGGLDWVLKNKELEVYILESFSKQLKEKLRKHKAIEVKKPSEISNNIYSSGPIQSADKYRLYEQALFLKSDKEIIVITGCAHPGLERIIEEARKLGNVKAIIGGFHGFDKLEVLQGIKIIAPCHCTAKKEEIEKAFPNNTKKCKAGLMLNF